MGTEFFLPHLIADGSWSALDLVTRRHRNSMETATLDDLMALNDQLVALAEAGVPIDVGVGERDLARTLESINAVVARSVSRRSSLEEALERDPMLPMWYRCLVLVGLRSRNMEAALDASSRVAASVEQSRQIIASSFFYPLVVCGLAYVGIIAFCLFYVPTMERTFASFELQPRIGLAALIVVRDMLPYWVAVPPILLLLIVLRSRRRGPGVPWARARFFRWFPGTSRAVTEARWASFAKTLAALDNNGVPMVEALPLAACASGDARLAQAGSALGAELGSGKPLRDDSAAPRHFPPFLRWAILHSEATVGRARALEMAARVYRDSAERRAARSQLMAPMIVVAVLGGSVALLYALAVFLPVAELLKALSA